MSGLVVFNQWMPVDGCSSGTGGDALLPFSEPVSVTSVNALSPLSQTPWPSPNVPITLMVNGRGFFNTAAPPDFSVAGPPSPGSVRNTRFRLATMWSPFTITLREMSA